MVKIILLALTLRLFMLGTVPPSLNWDEVSQGYTAYSLIETGRDEWGEKLPLFFRSYGEWKSAVYIYLIVPFIKVLGLNAWSVRLPSALAGVISVYLIYLIGKKLYSEKVGLWSAFLLSVTPWTFMLSRPALEANVALTLTLGGAYLFITNRYLLSAILLGLAPHTYNSAKVFVPLFVLYLVLNSKLFKKPKLLITFLFPLVIMAIPFIFGSGQALARFSQVGVLTDQKALGEFIALRGSKLIFNKYTFSLYKVADNWLSYLNPSFLALSGGTHHQHSLPYHGVLYLSVFGLALVGLVKKSSLPLAIIAIGILPAAMTRDSYHVLRSLFAAPGFVLLAGLGIERLHQTKYPYLKIVKWLLIIEIAVFMFSYFLWYPRTFARDWQFGHKEVAAYLAEHEGEYNQIVMTKWFGEPQLFLAFYNRWDPDTYQSQNRPLVRYESEGKLWLDQLPEYRIGKYTFKYLSWESEAQALDTLYIGKFDDFPAGVDIKKIINYPDGSVAFIIVAGDK